MNCRLVLGVVGIGIDMLMRSCVLGGYRQVIEVRWGCFLLGDDDDLPRDILHLYLRNHISLFFFCKSYSIYPVSDEVGDSSRE